MGFFKSILAGMAYSAVAQATDRAMDHALNRPQPVILPAQTPQAVLEDDGVPFYEKRVFGTPGASLYTATTLSVEARQAGIDGEMYVARELKRLAALYPNTYVFHSVKLPGHTGDIDHLVVQGNTMLLVDSKNWKHDAHYQIYHSTFDGDFVSRDGEDFAGGEIHLSRQIAEWQVEFMEASLDVQGVLVISNRKSRVSEDINAPYSFANLTGLATIFGNLFTEEAVPPMHPILLNRILSMVQNSAGPQPVAVASPNGVMAGRPVPRVRKPATLMTKWLVAWSFINYTLGMLLFPLAGLSAIPLLIVTHRHLSTVNRKSLGGAGLLTTVLVFSYILLVFWSLTMFIVLPRTPFWTQLFHTN